jgi:hypothetical protein
MTTSNHSNFSRNAINAAVQRGEQLRQDRIEHAARAREEAIRIMIEAAPQRAADILNGLPQTITQMVAEADDTPQSVVVMWVEPHEYDGATERNTGLGFHGPHQGQPENLKLAARQVYDALANLNPALVFRSKEALSGKGQLAIVIRLD